jgi:hypothetical protein
MTPMTDDPLLEHDALEEAQPWAQRWAPTSARFL